ncbi:hypothetical protein LJR220_003373 [Bradyrhizobium sp. LjRoot220]|uniref:hypothetical protein n=1 Tax=Bradyrhizobium sp. LjRoot220 TaxID=3342284 RepID=UPI003ED040AB
MTGPELKQLRHDLGDAIGRRLTLADMAKLCGLAPANGADTMRKWEDGAGPSGPVGALLSLLAYASDRHPIPETSLTMGYEVLEHDPYNIGDDFSAGRGQESYPAMIIRAAMHAEIVQRLS